MVFRSWISILDTRLVPLCPEHWPSLLIKSPQYIFVIFEIKNYRIKLSNSGGSNTPTSKFRIQNSEHFDVWIWDGLVLEIGTIATTIDLVPTIRKLNWDLEWIFSLDFKWFSTKWRPFVRISISWASRFQSPMEIQTICNPSSFWPFEIQTSPDLRSHCTKLFHYSDSCSIRVAIMITWILSDCWCGGP